MRWREIEGDGGRMENGEERGRREGGRQRQTVDGGGLSLRIINNGLDEMGCVCCGDGRNGMEMEG